MLRFSTPQSCGCPFGVPFNHHKSGNVPSLTLFVAVSLTAKNQVISCTKPHPFRCCKQHPNLRSQGSVFDYPEVDLNPGVSLLGKPSTGFKSSFSQKTGALFGETFARTKSGLGCRLRSSWSPTCRRPRIALRAARATGVALRGSQSFADPVSRCLD